MDTIGGFCPFIQLKNFYGKCLVQTYGETFVGFSLFIPLIRNLHTGIHPSIYGHFCWSLSNYSI